MSGGGVKVANLGQRIHHPDVRNRIVLHKDVHQIRVERQGGNVSNQVVRHIQPLQALDSCIGRDVGYAGEAQQTGAVLTTLWGRQGMIRTLSLFPLELKMKRTAQVGGSVKQPSIITPLCR